MSPGTTDDLAHPNSLPAMVIEERSKNRDGTSLTSNEYAALVLAVIVPFIGLCFGIYLKTEGSPVGNRVIGLSLVAAVVWLAFVFLL